MNEPFLTAAWRHLLMLNWSVDPALLADRVPAGTRLDLPGGRCWVSVVAFLMRDTRVKGVPVPFHQDFEEVNLRFYVRRDVPDEQRGTPDRRGVVFVRELVPKAAIAAVANAVYNENYRATDMDHVLLRPGGRVGPDDALRPGDRLRMTWQAPGGPVELAASIAGPAAPQDPDSHGRFITEHYWGYAAQRDGGTVEYEVEHPAWDVHPVRDVSLVGAVGSEYGDALAAAIDRPPESAFLAVGSAVSVMPGGRIP